MARYVLVGGLGTGLNSGCYLLLRLWWAVPPATLVALVLSTLASTELNRRFTFAGTADDPRRRHLQSVGTVVFYAGSSTLALAALGTLVVAPTPLLETGTVAATSLFGGLVRYLVLQRWVFADGPRPGWSIRQGRAVAPTVRV